MSVILSGVGYSSSSGSYTVHKRRIITRISSPTNSYSVIHILLSCCFKSSIRISRQRKRSFINCVNPCWRRSTLTSIELIIWRFYESYRIYILLGGCFGTNGESIGGSDPVEGSAFIVGGIGVSVIDNVAITGDTMTGNLVIDTTAAARVLGDASLTLVRNAGLTASVYGYSGPNVRWAMDLGDNTPETGTNTGSHFLLSCYTDAGVFINTPIKVIRSSGDVLLDHDPTLDLGVATKQYVDTELSASTTPPDDKLYARQGGATPGWVPTVDEAPLDGSQYVRESGGWVVSSVGKIATSDIVFNVATTGNDATGDGSVAAPFATVQHALNEASQYDYQGLYTVYINIANGTYTENVNMPNFKSTASNTPNWYNGGVNIIGDIVSTGATAPLVVLNGGGNTCLTNTTVSLYITGITFQATGQWSQGIWSNQDINIGHLGWNVEGTCLLHCGGSLQTAQNEDMVFVNNNLYIWGFLQAWASLYNIPFDFPAGGMTIGHCFLFVGGAYTYDYWSSNPISGGPVTGRRVDIDNYGILFTPDGTTDSIPGDGNPPDIRGMGSVAMGGAITSLMTPPISGPPTISTIPIDCWNVSKDAAGGEIYIAANDGGIIKKLQFQLDGTQTGLPADPVSSLQFNNAGVFGGVLVQLETVSSNRHLVVGQQ
jgi:hypothetical protein